MSTLALRLAIVCSIIIQVLGGAIVNRNSVGMEARDNINVAAGFPTDPRCLYGSLTGIQQSDLCYVVNQALASPGCTTRECGCNSNVASSIENCYSCQLKVTNAPAAEISIAQAFMDKYASQCTAAGFAVQTPRVNLNVTIRSDSASAAPQLASSSHFAFGFGLLCIVLAQMF